MKCCRCHTAKVKLIEVYCPMRMPQEPCYPFLTATVESCQFLCEGCIAGHDIPVFRPQLRQWNVGEVKEFDPKTSKHRVEFIDTTTEWVSVDATPTSAYIAIYQQHYRQETSQRDFQQLPETHGAAQYDASLSTVKQHDVPVPRPRINTSPATRAFPQNGQVMGKKSLPAHVLDKVNGPPQDSNIPRLRSDGGSGLNGIDHRPPHNAVTVTNPIKPTTHPAPSRTEVMVDNFCDRIDRKTGPRMWTLEEDNKLLQIVDQSDTPVRWPVVAKHIPGRTGKQCRERYLNHLKPKLNVEEWSPVEDALIFQLHRSCGSKWAMMSKMLRGRTDNGIKNRFHHLRRKLEKDLCLSVKHDPSDQLVNDIRSKQKPSEEEKRCGLLMKVRQVLPYLVAKSADDNVAQQYGYLFGPFREADPGGQMCSRCQLIAPSRQTGRFLCDNTGWCKACTLIPPYVSGSMLRECLSLSNYVEHRHDSSMKVSINFNPGSGDGEVFT